jgi:hypothetical protein
MRIYQDKDTTLDFALVPGEDRLEKIAAVNEPRLGGKPAGGVTQMLAKLQPYSISKVAQPLSKIFESLVYVAKFSEGERRSRMTPEQIAFLKLSVDKEHPPMPAGARMPAFSGRDLDGKPFSPERFAGKRLIVVAASVMHRMSRDIMGWALRYEQEHPGRFEIADVVYDAEDAVAQYRARGGRFTRIAVLDPDGKLHAAFNVGFVPAVYVFDASGLAVKMLTAPWTDYAAFAAELDAVP